MMPCYILSKWLSYHTILKPGNEAAFYKIVFIKYTNVKLYTCMYSYF